LFDPATSYEQAVALVSPPALQVHTLRWGSLPWMDACTAAMDAWCKRHGYPLRVHGPDPAEEIGKFSTLAILRDFLRGTAERMLFLDADVMIHAEAPAWPDGGGFRARPDLPGKAVEDWHAWLAEHHAGMEDLPWIYCNSGVWSCDRAAAEKFLAVAEGRPHLAGYQEQHQFNFWWHEAAAQGMEFTHLPAVWNVIASLEGQTAGCFIHFAGKKKEGMLKRFQNGEWPLWMPEEERLAKFFADPFGDRDLRDALASWKPAVPWEFKRKDPLHDRAIICPWLSGDAAWGEEELLRALRSWHLHFTDRDCPIYLLGDRPPRWLREGGRVKFIRIDYSKGRVRGLRSAYATGLQLAREVILTNDDFYLLQETGWDDLRVALRLGRLDADVEQRLQSRDGWQRTLGRVCRDLQKAGRSEVWNYATHTPFLYERDKAIEVLEKFHLRYRGSFENLYHNWHRTPSRPAGKLRTTRLPAPGARFLYHHDKTLTPELKEAIRAAFPDPAPWEETAAAAPAIPRKIHQTWKDRNIPREVYPEEWTASWKRHHPAWEYKLWTDRDLLDLARKDYPDFAELLATAQGVIRADVGRLLVLHRHGGLYADLDYLALRPLDPLVVEGCFHFCELPGGWASNALMACPPGDPLPLAMAREALARWQRRPTGKVEWIGGPDLLAEMARNYPVVRWKPEDVCPLDWRKGEHLIPAVPDGADAAAVTFWKHHW
jgi:mannosyltransferase OCH1-like enzyme